MGVDSDAFGVGSPTGSVTVNLRFPGQYFDAESDLHYNWNRYYNPATGRYVTSDPIGLDGGLNTYGYANANPALYADPEGLVIETGWDLGWVVYDAANGDWIGVGASICAAVIPGLPAGWHKAGDLYSAVKGQKNAEAAADIALAGGKKKGAAAQLDVDGKTYTDVSKKRELEDLHPDLQEALNDIPKDKRSDYHGHCAEIGCIDQALKDGVNPSGGKAKAVSIGNRKRNMHNAPKPPCTTCKQVLDKMGITE